MAAIEDGCADEDTEEHTCCDNQYTKINTDDNFDTAQFDVQVPTNFVIACISVFVLQIENDEASKGISFSEYNPPPLIKNIPVLYETFLI